MANNCYSGGFRSPPSTLSDVHSSTCTSCSENTAAVVRCEECEENLCSSCVEAHMRVRLTKDHHIRELGISVLASHLRMQSSAGSTLGGSPMFSSVSSTYSFEFFILSHMYYLRDWMLPYAQSTQERFAIWPVKIVQNFCVASVSRRKSNMKSIGSAMCDEVTVLMLEQFDK